MSYRNRWVRGLALALGVSLGSAAAPAGAAAKGEAAAADTGVVARALPLAIEGLRWGMTRPQLEECADRHIEAGFVEARKRARSIPAQRNLEAEIVAHKAAFRRSYVELVAGPDGFDTSPLVGEFSKGNGEALMRLPSASGGKLWFFLIGDRLWKTYEEVVEGPDAARGAALEATRKRVTSAAGGRAPKLSPAAPAKGRPAALHEWDDPTTHVRLWDRGAGVAALVYEERAMLARLPTVRKKAAPAPVMADNELSPQVSAVLRQGGAGKEGGVKEGGAKEGRAGKKGGAPRRAP